MAEGVPVRLVVACAVVLWAGATLLLSHLRWFSRSALSERLRPYTPGAPGRSRSGLLSVESFQDVVGPLSRQVGERVARLFGVSEELGVRLERIHSPLEVTSFRVRQLGCSLAALGVAALASLALAPLAPGVTASLLLGAPLLAFLALEQQVASASARWQRRLFLELPVVSEQLAMLLSAGFSLGSALNRLAARGRGACARDLRRVTGRMRQGLSEIDALREWAELARVPALDRLVPVLALNRDAGDLGRLIADEARGIRRDAQRQLVETMERRQQQVWIPVTVATLVPGVIFLAVPFIEALRLFSGT